MDLGFKEIEGSDDVYFNLYGYKYCIIEKKLSKNLFIKWEKETRLCEMFRIDKECSIKKRKPIESLDELKDIIDFYTD